MSFMNQNMGKWMMVVGIILLVVGALYYFAGDKVKWVGHLPGDISIERKNFKFYFPITTLILLSILINMIIRLFHYMK